MLQERAHQMRRDPTEPEKRLWCSLSNSQLAGFKFRRQQVIHPYIVDFLCSAKALVEEVDGDKHDTESDVRRDAQLADKGIRVLRFTNAEVMRNIFRVLESIASTLASSPHRWWLRGRQNASSQFTHPPAPSLEREGE